MTLKPVDWKLKEFKIKVLRNIQYLQFTTVEKKKKEKMEELLVERERSMRTLNPVQRDAIKFPGPCTSMRRVSRWFFPAGMFTFVCTHVYAPRETAHGSPALVFRFN